MKNINVIIAVIASLALGIIIGKYFVNDRPKDEVASPFSDINEDVAIEYTHNFSPKVEQPTTAISITGDMLQALHDFRAENQSYGVRLYYANSEADTSQSGAYSGFIIVGTDVKGNDLLPESFKTAGAGTKRDLVYSNSDAKYDVYVCPDMCDYTSPLNQSDDTSGDAPSE